MIARDRTYSAEITVPNGGTNTSIVDARGHILVAVSTPAVLTSTTATVQVSLDEGATWLAATDSDGSPITLTLAASRYVAVPVASLPAVNGYLRLVLGSAEAAARTLHLHLRPLD
jgi:hypothetical protein